MPQNKQDPLPRLDMLMLLLIFFSFLHILAISALNYLIKHFLFCFFPAKMYFLKPQLLCSS